MRRVALTTAALAASLTLVATPALAAAPVGYALTWESTTLYQLEEGASPVEVEGSTNVGSVTGLDFAPDGTGYAVTFNGQATLWAVDVTGSATEIGGIADADANAAQNCTALDYTDGVISIACDNVGPAINAFGTVDPTTGVFTLVTTLTDRVASIAHNPVDDVMYGFGYNGPVLAITAAGSTTVGSAPDVLWGADFDSTGALWVAANNVDETELLGWPLVVFPANGYDPDAGEFIENLSVYEDGQTVEEEPAVTPAAPALADTGLSDGTTALLGLGAALALLTGIALAMGARRAARQH